MAMSEEEEKDLEILSKSNYDEIVASNEVDLDVLLDELIETHGMPAHTDGINLGQDSTQDTLAFKDIG
jgi:threonine synthase